MKITAELTKTLNNYVAKWNCTAQVTSMNKNNRVLEGYVIKAEDENAAPVVYVSDLETTEEVLERVEDVMTHKAPSIDAEALVRKSYILDNVFAEVVSADSNLVNEDNVYRKFLDLAVIYRVKVDCEEGDVASFIVNKKVLEQAKIKEEELFEIVSKRDDYSAKSIFSAIKDMTDGQLDFLEIPEDENTPYVITTPDCIMGASVLCTDYLSKISSKLGSELFVLPSSIHEVIVVNDKDGMDVKALQEMVQQVNMNEVSPEDKLSDTVYHYGKDGLTIAA